VQQLQADLQATAATVSERDDEIVQLHMQATAPASDQHQELVDVQAEVDRIRKDAEAQLREAAEVSAQQAEQIKKMEVETDSLRAMYEARLHEADHVSQQSAEHMEKMKAEAEELRTIHEVRLREADFVSQQSAEQIEKMKADAEELRATHEARLCEAHAASTRSIEQLEKTKAEAEEFRAIHEARLHEMSEVCGYRAEEIEKLKAEADDLKSAREEHCGRSTALQSQLDELQQELERSREAQAEAAKAAGDNGAVNTKEELRQLRATLTAKTAALATQASALQEERRRSLDLQKALDAAKASPEKAMQHVAKVAQSQEQLVKLQRSIDERSLPKPRSTGAPSTVPEAAALAIFGDLELGRSGTTLAELGLGEFQSAHKLDMALQHVAVLMAWRSDVRMAIFGLWALCHLMYMASIFYTHFV